MEGTWFLGRPSVDINRRISLQISASDMFGLGCFSFLSILHHPEKKKNIINPYISLYNLYQYKIPQLTEKRDKSIPRFLGRTRKRESSARHVVIELALAMAS